MPFSKVISILAKRVSSIHLFPIVNAPCQQLLSNDKRVLDTSLSTETYQTSPLFTLILLVQLNKSIMILLMRWINIAGSSCWRTLHHGARKSWATCSLENWLKEMDFGVRLLDWSVGFMVCWRKRYFDGRKEFVANVALEWVMLKETVGAEKKKLPWSRQPCFPMSHRHISRLHTIQNMHYTYSIYHDVCCDNLSFSNPAVLINYVDMFEQCTPSCPWIMHK